MQTPGKDCADYCEESKTRVSVQVWKWKGQVIRVVIHGGNDGGNDYM